jgi:predicted 3-demethylubiquinone-9 3-methyltransferase (glyoxalase superfamily)
MPAIVPHLWFQDRVEEAVSFYTSVFPDAKILNLSRIENAGPAGDTVVTAAFELQGQEFMALSGAPASGFTEAISFFIRCSTQEEVDYYWEKLTDGGDEQPCGWLRDRFGLSWQVIPDALGECIGDPDPARAQRAMQAMLQMKKIDVAALRRAQAG